MTTPYASVAETKTFWAEYPSVLTTAWSALSDADQLAYLVMATKELDSFRWQGFKLYSAQEHAHPRKYRIDPYSYSPWGILMVYLDPWGYWYEPTNISVPFYPSGYWVLGSHYIAGAMVLDLTTQGIYQCKLLNTAAATNEPGVGVDWQLYWNLTTGYPPRVRDACCLEAKATFEFYQSADRIQREILKKAGAQSVGYGQTRESYIPGSRWNDEGMKSADAYQLIEVYLEKSTLII